jgi:predicted Zn-ribbon and HTH transcriptional regulator
VDSPQRRTRRQALGDHLAEREWAFEELRAAFSIPVHLLEDDLRHLDRSLRRSGARIEVTPPRCRDCDFRFNKRAPKRFHKPGRCPHCRGEHIIDTRLEVIRP